MKKKLICCLCALSIIAGMITCTPIFADGYDMTKAVETLKALDIIESADSAKVSKDYLVSALAGFLYDEPDALGTPEYIARLTGMLTAGEAYDGNDTATADFAVRCAVIALGYGIKAQEYGGNSAAYTRIASELDITDGVSVGADAVFTMKDLVRLLYQMLDAEPLVPNFGSGSELKYEVKKGETLLSQNRGIYKVEGIETATARTSLDGESGIGTDKVELDGEKYDTEVDACKLLGRNVRAYVRDENDTRTVIYIEEYEKRNDILTIEAEDIKSVSEDFSAVEYYKTEVAVKKAKIADAPSVIFNGKFYGRYTAEDLKPGIGRLELIDNDRDGRYDVINIISYETMVVDSVNTADKEITNYFAYDGSIAKLELEPDKGEVEYKIFDSEGKEIGIGAINRLDVLSVAKSKASDENYIEIYVANETCEGTIDYIDIDGDDTILSIDGIDYLESYHFKEYLKYESKELNIGDRIAAYIDFFGNVAYFKKLQEDYCIFATARYDGETDEHRITYMTLDEDWIVTPFAEKLKVNSEMMSAEAAYVILSGMKPQVVKLRENAAGELKEIQTATETSESIDNKFTKTPLKQYSYRKGTRNTFGDIIYPEEGAKIAVIPKEYTSDRNLYRVREVTAFFTADTDVSVEAYDIDNFGFTNLVSVNEDTTLMDRRANKSMFMVTRSRTTLDSNGDLVSCVDGNIGAMRNFTLYGEDETTFAGVKAGDVLYVSFNSVGAVNYYKKIISTASGVTPINVSNYFANNTYIAGEITDVDAGKERIKLNLGTSELSLRLPNTLQVMKYNASDRTCDVDDTSCLQKGKDAVIWLTIGSISEIIMVEY